MADFFPDKKKNNNNIKNHHFIIFISKVYRVEMQPKMTTAAKY